MNDQDHRWEESNQELVRDIRDEILARGPIRFSRFMELALYHDPHGYYRSARVRPGRSGDFLTAPEAHPIFGATLAAQIVDFDEILDRPNTFTLIEHGAGSGLLARPLLAELRQKQPDLYDRISYRPVELNTSRLEELRQRLKVGGHAERLRADSDPSPGVGAVLANEFLDALPARRITRHDGKLYEWAVSWRDGWFADEMLKLDDPDVFDYLNRHKFELHEGESVEFHPGIGQWLGDVAGNLERGFVLIIDYGYPAGELFHEHRRAGTVKTYFQHGASEEFFRGIGEQDITAHVNFDEVVYQAEQRGFEVIGLTTQADLLSALGIGERLVNLQQHEGLSAEDYLATRSAVFRMIDPGAMGRFRALFLGRSLPEEAAPIGLRSAFE